MNLYIKQRVFSWKDRFTVYDAQGNDRYYVEGEFFTFGKRLHIYDTSGQEQLFIRQKLLSFLPQYEIFRGNIQVARVVKEFTLLRQAYTVEGPNWQIEGDFWAHDYSIISPVSHVATISKQWFAWGDTYEISLAPGADETMALATVLVIDACLESANN